MQLDTGIKTYLLALLDRSRNRHNTDIATQLLPSLKFITTPIIRIELLLDREKSISSILKAIHRPTHQRRKTTELILETCVGIWDEAISCELREVGLGLMLNWETNSTLLLLMCLGFGLVSLVGRSEAEPIHVIGEAVEFVFEGGGGFGLEAICGELFEVGV